MFRLIGDGSTVFTGSQLKQSAARRLAPGQKRPQFVVFSWGGAGEESRKLFSHFREVTAFGGHVRPPAAHPSAATALRVQRSPGRKEGILPAGAPTDQAG